MAYTIHRDLSVIGFGGSSYGEIELELTEEEQCEIYKEIRKHKRYEDVVWRLAEMTDEGWFKLTENPESGRPAHYNEIVKMAMELTENNENAEVAYNHTLHEAIRKAIEECDPDALI